MPKHNETLDHPADEEEVAAAPKVIGVDLPAVTIQQIAELLPAITLWAKGEGCDEPVGPADVIVLAVHRMHHDVYSRAHALAATVKSAESPTAH